ncbi:MAG TPA: hypothetical protein VFH30_06905 [Acidimicrobiales bacterium]|nr:hypothetical protein [Acidimicrobiales bacterium]
MTAAASFEARLVHTDHEAAVVVRGEIDVATCGRLWPVMEQAISLSPRLVLDQELIAMPAITVDPPERSMR